MAVFFSIASFAESMKFISIEVAPWAYLNEGQYKHVGIFPDIVEEIERRTGYTIEVTITPFTFERVNRELMIGRQDCTIVIQDEEREDFVLVGEKLFDHMMGVVAIKKYPLKIYPDLYDLTISTHKSLIITKKFFNDDKLKKEFDVNYDIGLRKIKHGRVNAVAGAISTIQYLAKNNNIEDMLGEPLILKLEPVSLQCSKKSKNIDLIESVNDAIRKMKVDGTLEKIMAKNL